MSLSDEVYEELAQDIPSPDDPFIQQFISGSRSLHGKEAALRADAPFRSSLSPIVRRADAIVSRIRSQENETIWIPAAHHDTASPNMTFHPGMPFIQAKPLVETTNLWRIVRHMPKGAALHSHMDGMVDFDFLFDVMMKTPGMHVSADAALSSPEALREAKVYFRFRKREDSEISIWDGGYLPGTWRRLDKAADEFPDGGKEGFLRWLKDQCTLTPKESLATHHGPDAIWKSFVRCFQFADSIIHYEPIFRAFLQRLMSTLHADGVSWIELRFTWGLNYCRKGREEPEPDYDAMFSTLDEELARFQSADSSHASFWGFRTIWTAPRASSTRDIIQDMDNCITTKLAYPHLVAGYDVCGKEDRGRTLKDLLPELFWFRKQCAQEGVDIPFFFHAGETLASGQGTPDENLYDAILLGTRRLGHACSLYRHPLLVDMVKEKRILVESCPISNEVLRLCGSVRSHPLPALLARDVPCALGNDVPAMLGQGTSGASHDFWEALQGWDELGLAGLGALAENSVRWAAFEDESAADWTAGVKEASLGRGLKAKRLKEWATEWERFCLWIVTEFGDEYEDEGGPEVQGEEGGSIEPVEYASGAGQSEA